MALVMMEDESQSAAAAAELTGKSVDEEGNVGPPLQQRHSENGESGRIRPPLLVEPARREVMTAAEKDERAVRARVRQIAATTAAQKRADAAVLARRQELMQKARSLRATVPEEERNTIITRHKFQRAGAQFGPGRRQLCPACWLLTPQCICTPPTPPAILAAFPHRTLVYLHVKEYGRQSNTGALAAVAFPPPQSAIFVAGIAEHEEVQTHRGVGRRRRAGLAAGTATACAAEAGRPLLLRGWGQRRGRPARSPG